MMDRARRGTCALSLAGILTALTWVLTPNSPSGHAGTAEEVARDLSLAGLALSLTGIAWVGALCLLIGGAGLARRAGAAPAVSFAVEKEGA